MFVEKVFKLICSHDHKIISDTTNKPVGCRARHALNLAKNTVASIIAAALNFLYKYELKSTRTLEGRQDQHFNEICLETWHFNL